MKLTYSYYDATIRDMKEKLEEKEHKANEIKEAFLEFKREIAKEAVHSKTGKGIPPKVCTFIVCSYWIRR
jgi:hypothetical protein